MKCPYPDCHKDYNENWSDVFNSFINPEDFKNYPSERRDANRLYVVTKKCRFCGKYFHEIYIGRENVHLVPLLGLPQRINGVDKQLELLFSYPVSKSRFEAKGIPREIIEFYNEAERCKSVGSLTGAGACLRKTIYALCNAQKVEGRDYKEKIGSLPLKGTYRDLLKYIKWLGDNATKADYQKYKKEDVEIALEILPLVIDELYTKDEKIDQAKAVLAKANSSIDPTTTEATKTSDGENEQKSQS